VSDVKDKVRCDTCGDESLAQNGPGVLDHGDQRRAGHHPRYVQGPAFEHQTSDECLMKAVGRWAGKQNSKKNEHGNRRRSCRVTEYSAVQQQAPS
jgi:hypothetical protein